MRRADRVREIGRPMRKCVPCGGTGGFWRFDKEYREWEFDVCDQCGGKGRIEGSTDAVSESQSE